MSPVRRPALALAPAALALTLAGLAAGGPCAAQATSTPVTTAAARERANRLFAQGAEAYGDGRYADAARAFREAYQLLPAPPLLYNLGRALEAQGDDAAAIDAYERFLAADPNSTDRPAVEQSLTTLRARESERRAREQAARAAAQPPAPSPTASAALAPVARDGSRDEGEGGGISAAPWVMAGVGVLALGGGVGVGLWARDTYDRAVAEPTQQGASDLAGQANDLATVANVLWVAGGVVALGGLVWGVADAVSSGGGGGGGGEARGRASARRVWLVPAWGGAAVAGTF